MTHPYLLKQARAVTHPGCRPLVIELADEIERLNGELHGLLSTMRHCGVPLLDLTDPPESAHADSVCSANLRAALSARRALEGK